ncbi:MAG: hypothetical protein LQ340_006636 [Diploschistes diacapsis]|nr:MAG: hypothetical protein LQ340_006636 [Diploschistes diacapsis]
MAGPINTLLVSLLINALSILVLWLESTSLGPLTAFAIINGMANGGFFSSMPTVIGSTFNSNIVAVALAMTITGYAGGYLLGAPLAGYILTATGGPSAPIEAYRPAIYYAGSIAMTAAILVAVVVGLKACVEFRGKAVQLNGKPHDNNYLWVMIFDEHGHAQEIHEYLDTALAKEVFTTN